MASITEKFIILGSDLTGAAIASAKAGQAALRKSSDDLSQNMSTNAAKFSVAMLAITGTIFAAKKAWDMAEEAANFQQSMVAFRSQLGSLGVDADRIFADIRQKSAGIVDDKSLVTAASAAISLGIEADKLGGFMEIARAKARDMGITTEKAFADLTLAVSRGSPKILDNLGLVVKLGVANKQYAAALGTTVAKLTDAERRTAFQTAAMNAGLEAVQRYNLGTLTMAERMQKFQATLVNVRIQLGAFIQRVGIGAVAALQALSAGILNVVGVGSKILAFFAHTTDALGISKNAVAGWEFEASAAFAAAGEEAAKSAENFKLAMMSTEDLIKAQEEQAKGVFGARPEAPEVVDTGAVAARIAQEQQVQDVLRGIREREMAAQATEDQQRLQQLDAFYATQISRLIENDASQAEVEIALAAQRAERTRVEEEQLTAIKKAEQANRLAAFATFGSNLAALGGRLGKAGLAIQKAMAIREIIVNTPAAAINAYKAMAGIPIIGPGLGVAAAAAAIAFGALQLRNVLSERKPGGAPPSAPSLAAAAPAPAPVAQAAPNQNIVNITVLGNIIDQDQFARDLAPSINRAVGAGSDFGLTVQEV